MEIGVPRGFGFPGGLVKRRERGGGVLTRHRLEQRRQPRSVEACEHAVETGQTAIVARQQAAQELLGPRGRRADQRGPRGVPLGTPGHDDARLAQVEAERGLRERAGPLHDDLLQQLGIAPQPASHRRRGLQRARRHQQRAPVLEERREQIDAGRGGEDRQPDALVERREHARGRPLGHGWRRGDGDRAEHLGERDRHAAAGAHGTDAVQRARQQDEGGASFFGSDAQAFERELSAGDGEFESIVGGLGRGRQRAGEQEGECGKTHRVGGGHPARMPGQLHHYLTDTLRPFARVGHLDRRGRGFAAGRQLFEPQHRPTSHHGPSAAGPSSRGPRASADTRLHPGDGHHAGARHRRQHRDLLDRERRRAAAARVSEARTADVPHQPVPGPGLHAVLGVAAGVLRVPRAESVVRRGRCLHDRRGQPDGRGSAAPRALGSGHRRTDACPADPAGAGPAVCEGRDGRHEPARAARNAAANATSGRHPVPRTVAVRVRRPRGGGADG